jgi:hypothetical protein
MAGSFHRVIWPRKMRARTGPVSFSEPLRVRTPGRDCRQAANALVKNGASKVEPAPVRRTVPAAEACDVLDALEADVHAVSAAVMASAAAAVSAAAARCRPGGEAYLAVAWRVQVWAPACTASQGEPSGGV